MYSDTGNKKVSSKPQKPTYDEMAMMGVANDQCGNCDLYRWQQMMGEWMPLDGSCTAKIVPGSARADEKKCDYFVQRSKL